MAADDSSSIVQTFRQTLLSDVASIPKAGIPASVGVVGDGSTSFCLVQTSKGKCPVGGAIYGDGRIVAMGHNGYLWNGIDEKGDNDFSKFLKGALTWVSGKNCQGALSCDLKRDFITPILKISVIGLDDNALNKIVLKMQNALPSVKILKGIAAYSSSLPDIEKALSIQPNLVIWTNQNCQAELIDASLEILDERAEALLRWIHNGGGLVTGVCGWGWQQLAKVDVETRSIFNQVLLYTGLIINSDYSPDEGFSKQARDATLSQKSAGDDSLETNLIKAASKVISGGSANDDLQQVLGGLSSLPRQAFAKGVQSRQGLPDASDGIRRNLQGLIFDAKSKMNGFTFPVETLEPSSKMSSEVKSACVYMALHEKIWATQNPRFLEVPPGAAAFPGAVIESSGERLRGFIFTLNPRLKRWQTTGVYVIPGETVSITISDAALRAFPDLKLGVTVGAHTDSLKILGNPKYKLSRYPKIATRRDWTPQFSSPISDGQPFYYTTSACKTSTIEVANPFGGPLYLEYFSGFKEDRVPISFSITGGVAMPYYNVQKEMYEVPWNAQSDSYPHASYLSFKDRLLRFGNVPLGELEGRYVILTTPIKALLKVTDPKEVVEFFDEIIGHELALSGQTIDYKERIVMDVQIAYGWLHAGYPIMGFLANIKEDKEGIPEMFNIKQMRKVPSWGFYHELGHNRQKSEWTFDGTLEVTVNIFSLYVCKAINNQDPLSTTFVTKNTKPVALKYLSDPSIPFSYWQQNADLGLAPYAILLDRYGWAFISDVFRAYKKIPSSSLSNFSDKITEWVKQTSLAAKEDLREFFKQWRWPFDDQKLKRHLDPLPKALINSFEIFKAI